MRTSTTVGDMTKVDVEFDDELSSDEVSRGDENDVESMKGTIHPGSSSVMVKDEDKEDSERDSEDAGATSPVESLLPSREDEVAVNDMDDGIK